jgi:hypothetical protein
VSPKEKREEILIEFGEIHAMDLCTPNPKQDLTQDRLKGASTLLQSNLHVCNDCYRVRLRLNLEATCFTQLREKFKKVHIFGFPKIRDVTPINPNFIISQLGSEVEVSYERMTSPP